MLSLVCYIVAAVLAFVSVITDAPKCVPLAIGFMASGLALSSYHG